MQSDNIVPLFKTRRFLPLFLVQFFGAFNDNIFKYAFTILATFHFAVERGWNAATITQIIACLFVLPFFLFSALAGQLADKYEKSRIVRILKVCEILIISFGSLALYFDNPWMLFVTIFLLGAQSAFFGPLKYSLLPVYLKKEELVAGNAIFEAATYIAILCGTLIGGAFGEDHRVLIASLLLLFAFVGWIASLFVPEAPSQNTSLKINTNIFTSTLNVVKESRSQVGVFRCILGISWFWLVGAFWLTLTPAYVATHLNSNGTTVSVLLIMFAVGIGVGSFLCNHLLRGELSAKFVPLAGLAISLFMIDFAWLTNRIAGLYSSGEATFSFFSYTGINLCVDLLGIAICGGIFSVPLYALMQHWSSPKSRSRIIAANNIINSFAMALVAAGSAIMFALGFEASTLILLIAVFNGAIAIYIISIVPEAVIHTFIRLILKLVYRVEVRGVGNYKNSGPRRVIIANHTSFLDAILLTAFLPERPTFAIATTYSTRWWLKPFLWAVKVYPLDPTNPLAVRALTGIARSGTPVVIFPEGRLTVTGALMKVYEGPGLIADKAKADIIPVQINGATHSIFSRLGGKIRRHWFPKITLTILPKATLHPPSGTSAREGRADMAQRLYDILAEIYVTTTDSHRTLYRCLLDAARTHGYGLEILDDPNLKPLSYRKLLAVTLLLGPKLCAKTSMGDPIGLLIANSSTAVAAIFGVQSMGRICAMLNYGAGAANIVSACQTAKVRVVWTSRKFVETANLEEAIKAMEAINIEIFYMEDLAERSLLDWAKLLAGMFFARRIYSLREGVMLKTLVGDTDGARESRNQALKKLADSPAFILFTSGSSGMPKGVALSHRNIYINCQQLASRIDFTNADRFFNSLPIFHAFGLTAGTMTPLIQGAPVFMYPTPLHYGIIPELIYQTNSTVIFGTNTFLAGYAKRAHPYDFFSTRHIIAGAEKLKESTRRTYAERFGIRILEGYGATEAAPVLSVNSPMHNRMGSVGRLLPAIEHRIEPVPGIEKGGSLWVRGDNIMLGYILHDKPGIIQPPENGWYDTGDIVEIDEDGYVTIIGRAKRFAKIAGEMVSLAAVEELAASVWPEALVAAITRPHPQRGEEILLITNEENNPERSALVAAAKQRGISELYIPKVVIQVEKFPVLSSGKPDYVTLQKQYPPESEN